MQYDFVALGDITIDAFIDLSTDDSKIENDTIGREHLCVLFGGKIPYEDLTVVPAVGNASNASVAAKRLGLKSALVSNVGHDRDGKDCIETLRNEGVHTNFVRVHEDRKTNYHFVLRHGAERTILIKHEHYPYVIPALGKAPRYLYFSSVGADTEAFHHELASYTASHPDMKLVFQPGTYQLRLGYNKLKDLYRVTDTFFCNKEEAQELLGSKGGDSIKKLLKAVAALGPRTVIITDGTRGAYAYEDGSVFFVPAYPDQKTPIDRTGAGDSFSSTVIAAQALGHNLKTALLWGPINSMSVVQHIGAQAGLLSRVEIEEYLKCAPEWYNVKEL